MNAFVKGIIVTLGITLAFSAQAAYIGIDQNQAGLENITVSENNDYANNPDNNPELTVGQSGFGGATVNALQDGPFSLTFTFLSKHANFTNSFHYGSGDNAVELFNTDDPFGTSRTITYRGGAGPIDFFFNSSGYVNDTQVTNVNNDNNRHPNFHTFWEEGSNTLIIALDDHGAGPDNDHDDMIIRISAAPVPEPGTLALLGLGLAGLGLALRRRSNA